MTHVRALRPAAVPLVAALAVVASVVLLARATGHAVGPAAEALWSGGFGSATSLLSYTLVRTTPLLLLGLAVALAFRAGVLNIGGEGQFLVGAVAAFAVSLFVSGWPSVVAQVALLAGGALAGSLWAGVAAWLRYRFGVFEVISTLMLNFIAALLLSFLVRGPLQEPTGIYPSSPPVGEAARLARILPGYQLHVGFLLACAAAVALWLVLRGTAAGFRIRVVGASATAAASAGRVRVGQVGALAFLASGALAGLAGAAQLGGVTFALYEGLSPGYGYRAIAVALLARLHPLGVVVAAIGFGALDAGADAMQRDAGIPAQFVSIIEAVVVLAALAVGRAGALTARAVQVR